MVAPKDAFTDIKTWGLIVSQIGLLSSPTWTYFFPSIAKTLGYSSAVTRLITAPVCFFGFSAPSETRLWRSARTNELFSSRGHWLSILSATSWSVLHTHGSPLHRHVRHVLRLVLCLQYCASMEWKHHTSDPHEARHGLCACEHLW